MTQDNTADQAPNHPNLVTAYIGLGSNLQDPKTMLDKAMRALKAQHNLQVDKVSDWCQTQPLGGPKNQHDYLNGVVQVETSLSAEQLLDTILDIEKKLGRKRQQRWGPRCIDLDLLLYGQQIIRTEKLQVPHPLMHQRKFVLQGLAQIAPDATHPLLKKNARQMLQEIHHKEQDPTPSQ